MPIIQFRKFGDSAIQKERELRVETAEKDNARFTKGWRDNPSIQKVRAYRENQKLESLKRGLVNDGDEMRVEFSKDIEDASDFVDMISGETNPRNQTEDEIFKEIEDDKEKDEENEGEKLFKQFMGEPVKEKEGQEYLTADIPNRLVKKVNGFVDLSDTEEDFELSETDKQMLGNLIKAYGSKI